ISQTEDDAKTRSGYRYVQEQVKEHGRRWRIVAAFLQPPSLPVANGPLIRQFRDVAASEVDRDLLSFGCGQWRPSSPFGVHFVRGKHKRSRYVSDNRERDANLSLFHDGTEKQVSPAVNNATNYAAERIPGGPR